MSCSPTPLLQLADLAKEYRASMSADVLHAWAADVVAAIKAQANPQSDAGSGEEVLASQAPKGQAAAD